MVYNGYYKVMSNSPKNGHLPIPVIFDAKKWEIDVKYEYFTGSTAQGGGGSFIKIGNL